MPTVSSSRDTGAVHFEDFVVGERRQLGGKEITRDAILRFATEFDPLPIHLDEDAAKRSIYKGLIASGLHTLCVVASIVVDEVLADSTMTGSAGMTDTKWFKPVRAGDTLSVVFTVEEAEPWVGRPTIGRVRARLDALNQDEQKVMTTLVDYLFLRRSSEPSA